MSRPVTRRGVGLRPHLELHAAGNGTIVAFVAEYDRDEEIRLFEELETRRLLRALEPWRQALKAGLVGHPDDPVDEAVARGWAVLLASNEYDLDALHGVFSEPIPRRPSGSNLETDVEELCDFFEGGFDLSGEFGVLQAVAGRNAGHLLAFSAAHFSEEVEAVLLEYVSACESPREGSALGDLIGSDIVASGRYTSWPQEFHPLIALAEYDLIDHDGLPACFRVESLFRRLVRLKDNLERLALEHRLLGYAQNHADALILGLPLHIVLARPERIDLITAVALEDSAVLDAVKRLSLDAGYVAQVRAEGMFLAISEGDIASLSSTYQWSMDRTAYSIPVGLQGPSATWLNDVLIEAELRARIDAAVARLPEGGISEETEVTGALVNNLARIARRDLPSGSTAHPPIQMSITSTNAKTNERVTGADIGLELVIDLPGRERVHIGHLVQVKQSLSRETAASAPRWKIERSQIDLMLKIDPSATYWLLTPWAPKVVVVPAKALWGLFKSGADSCTVQYEHVRSASIPLSQELVDLFLGLWIGTPWRQHESALDGSRHTPSRVLQIELTGRDRRN